jgi:two-component system, NarL family, response regulator NreC
MHHLHRIDDRDPDRPAGKCQTRVVLANDHPGLRRSLRWLLDRADDLDVVGEATDFEAAVHEVAAQHPDVLVLDLRMPHGFSAQRIKGLRTTSPGTEIVVTTMNVSDVFASEALRAGAIGFVVADSADRELTEAVQRAARGLPYTSPRLRRAVA